MNPERMIELLHTLRRLAYDTGWLSCKVELGPRGTAESDNRELVTLIERRNEAFHELEAALIWVTQP